MPMKNNLDFFITFGHKETVELTQKNECAIKKNNHIYTGAKCIFTLNNNITSTSTSIKQDNLIEYLIKTSTQNLDLFLNDSIIQYYSKSFNKDLEYFIKEIRLIDQDLLMYLLTLIYSYLENKKNISFQYDFSIYLKDISDIELSSHFKKCNYLRKFNALKIYVNIKNTDTNISFGDYLYLREPINFIINNPYHVYTFIDTIFFELNKKSINILNPGLYNCILSNQVSCLLIHETIGHISEADNFYKNENQTKTSALKSLDSKFNLYDLANNFRIKSCPIKFFIDSEGSLCKDLKIVDNGKIINLLTNKIYSNSFGETAFGNARSQNIFSEPLIRMRNTYVYPGEQSFDSMLKDITYGVYIHKSSIGTTDSYGNFTLHVTSSYIIKNGTIKDRITPFTINGNCFDILKNIISISNDLEWYIFDCSKYGQEIYVSCGCPKISCYINIKQ